MAQKQYSPVDIAFRSSCVENFDEDRSDEASELEVNCSEERWLDSYVRIAKYLAVLRRYYNKNVKERLFVVGDLVLKWKIVTLRCCAMHFCMAIILNGISCHHNHV
jgi:hypothetical protein